MKNPIVILVGPSGVGKSTLVEEVIRQMPQFVDLVTYTTREMRENENQGNPYHFVTKEKFLELRDQNFFVEWAEVHGNGCFYGTPRDQLIKAWSQNQSVIMDIDVRGALHFKKEYSQSFTIFIHPPSLDVLRERILQRESKKPGDLDLRLKNALLEMNSASQFQKQIRNDDFQSCFLELKKTIENYLNSL